MPPVQANEFKSDLGVVKEAMTNAVITPYAIRKTSYWALWCTFCNGSHINPFLQNLSNPVTYLQFFAVQYSDGSISPSGRPVRAKAAPDAPPFHGTETHLVKDRGSQENGARSDQLLYSIPVAVV